MELSYQNIKLCQWTRMGVDKSFHKMETSNTLQSDIDNYIIELNKTIKKSEILTFDQIRNKLGSFQ